MHTLKRWLSSWFGENFDIIREIREGQTGWSVQSRSCQGFLLFLVLTLPFFLISIGYIIFLIFTIYPIVFSTLMSRLGIASWLGLPLLVTAFFGCFINLPLFIRTRRYQSKQRGNFEIFPLWPLKRWLFYSYAPQYQPDNCISLNVSGGLLPIILALYQFHRVQPLAILSVTAIVGVLSYFLVTVIPGRAIVTKWSRFWLITSIAAVSAMLLVSGGIDRFDVSVAFAGGVLGTTIGADLLHLKDVCPENAATPLSIGGAGWNDGIALCGLYALMISEWSPAAMSWLFGHFR